MNRGVETMQSFYEAFQKKDIKAMQALYSDSIVFSDPAFGLLEGNEVKAMWAMLLESGKDLKIEFRNIKAVDEEYVTGEWTAYYTFSKTGNKVVNHIKSFMRVHEGKIIEHSGAFRLSTWAAQALGFKGCLFGWTNFLKRSVQRQARQSLQRYMEKNNL